MCHLSDLLEGTEDIAEEYLAKSTNRKLNEAFLELREDYMAQIMINHIKRAKTEKGKKIIIEKFHQKMPEIYSVEEMDMTISMRKLVNRHVNRYLKSIDEEMVWNMFESKYCSNTHIDLDHEIQGVRINVRKCEKKHKYTCSKCMKISYCSKECSVQYWPYHKKLCNCF